MMLMGRMLQEARKRTPDATALWFGSERWTYAELDDVTTRVAAGLAGAGVRPGERVALFLPNCPELVFSYFACFKLGAIAVPLNYRYREAEARYALEHSGATTLIVHHRLQQEVAGLPLAGMGIARRYLAGGDGDSDFTPFEALIAAAREDCPANDFTEQQTAAILYTSGSTARPKGVTYSHATLWHNCVIQAATFAFSAADVMLISTAACHAAAFTGQLLPSVFVGGTSVLTHLPNPTDVLAAITAHRVTRLQMLPANLEDLVEHLEQHRADVGSVRCCTVGGDVVPVDLHVRFNKLTGRDVTELYGMTEVLSCITNPPFGAKKRGSIGKPAVDTRGKLVDITGGDVPTGAIGELLVHSPAMMVGYWNDPAATAETVRDGWMHTGDLARRDEDGYYWFVSRKKEIIIRGGSNISPLEVEEALDEHPAVHLSCVLGWPDKHFGQIVVAYVEPRPDAPAAPTVDELRSFVAARLAAYKVPERIIIMKRMPLNATGKVDRKKLHAIAPHEAEEMRNEERGTRN
jgi:long-chain acyl-CoA synthetase